MRKHWVLASVSVVCAVTSLGCSGDSGGVEPSGAGGAGGGPIGAGGASGAAAGNGGTSAGGAGAGVGGAGAGVGGAAGGVADASVDGAGRPDVVLRDVQAVDRGPNPSDVLVRVTNLCPFDLWIHAAGQQATLQPDNQQIKSGESQDYYAPKQWTAARVTAFLQGPDSSGRLQNEIDKVEATFGVGTDGKAILNTNITYVDWVGLPSELQAFGSGADCTRVGCYVPQSQVLDGCPAGLLQGQKCLSAGAYCSNQANRSTTYCHAFDAKITECAQKYADCAGATGATTGNVYGCSGAFFSSSPKYCAAINRGVLDTPQDTTPATSFYQTAPYNTYAAWVHTVCPGIYAFAYDDYGKDNESGFHVCAGGTQLNVTFCPAG